MKRRKLLKTGTVLLLGTHQIARGATVLAVRVWPAPEYTRFTIESDVLLASRSFVTQDPPRLALDIEGIDLHPTLRELVAKVKSDDPFVAGVRVAQAAPGRMRLVIDLKQAALPQVFNLPPVAAYQHRLVVDFFPVNRVDPLEALIAERMKEKAATPVPAPAAAPAQATVPAPASAPKVTSAPTADPLGELIARHGERPVPTLRPAAEVARPAPLAFAKTDRLIIVALDPGHGGEDPGAIGPGGTREKDVVLKIAHLLRDRLHTASVNGSPIRAFLTRDGDYFVPLHVRVDKARRVQADLFVSVHADAFITPTARGASVFALSQSGASSSAARWMADKENRADLVGGINIKTHDAHVVRAMLDMSTTAQIKDSLRLGSALLGEIGHLGRLHKSHVEQAGFAVLKAPDIPSVLVETAFISNPEEEQKLRSPEYQEQLAAALVRGIERYFARNPPLARNRSL